MTQCKSCGKLSTLLEQIREEIGLFCDDCCYPTYRLEFDKRICLYLECPLYRHCPYKLSKSDLRKYRKEVENARQESEEKDQETIKSLLSNQR